MPLQGARCIVQRGDALYPQSLETVRYPPEKLYIIGSTEALVPGLAVIGARKATPYGRACARRFAQIAAEKGICIISGGAKGCDSEAHRAALDVGGKTAVFLGGGCDKIYPAEHFQLFQEIIDSGGALVSEHSWDVSPRPAFFRQRNRLIAGLADALLIVEAGLPSGTFGTADDALDYGKEVYVVPGAITSNTSRGSNRLLLQGATPIVDEDSFEDALFNTFSMLKRPDEMVLDDEEDDPIIAAIRAEPLSIDQLVGIARSVCGSVDPSSYLMEHIALGEAGGKIARQPDGRWGPTLQNKTVRK